MRSSLSIVLIASIAIATTAQDLPSRRLDYPEFRADKAKLPADRPPLPDDLIRPADAPQREHRDHRRDGVDPQAALDRDAIHAARAVAQELAEGYAFREYYKVGFYQGMHSQIREPHPGRGLFDSGANLAASRAIFQREGRDLAAAAATGDAPGLADQAVTQQFRDLSRQPSAYPATVRPQPPSFSAAVSYPPPQLDEIMTTVAHANSHSLALYQSWNLDPLALYRCAGYRDCFDDRWQDPDFAFKHFTADSLASAAYLRLDKPGRERFAQAFIQAYPDCLTPLIARVQDSGFDQGWREGHDFGWDVRTHWELCSGYAFGAEREVRESASRAYIESYEQAYDKAYRRAYERWNESVVPELGELELVDNNGDGVLQPGEFFHIRYDAVNYGGRAGRAELALSGPALEQPVKLSLDLPARDRIQQQPQLEARIDDRAEPWRSYPLTITLGEDSQQLELQVRHPLTLNGTTVVDRDNLRGTFTLNVAVENLSRRPVANTVLRWSGEHLVLDELPAQGRRDLRISFSGIDPLDLIAGQTGIIFELFAEDRRWSSLEFSLSEQVTDLTNDDLLQVLLTLTHEQNPDPARVRKAHQLWLQRIESDWTTVAASDGNPYKDDSRDAVARTQLGRFVQAYLTGRTTMTHPEVLSNLREDLIALGKRLPGAHPFLRKSYRRLAQQL